MPGRFTPPAGGAARPFTSRYAGGMWLLLALGLAQEAADLPGRWYPSPDSEIARLEALGYVGGYVPRSGPSGVTHREPGAQDGVRLYTSGHRPWAGVIDLDGRLLHSWSADILEAFPDQPELAKYPSAHTWRRVALLDDGSLLAIHEGIGLVKLDRESRVVWSSANRAHHDLEVLPDGRILILTRTAHDQGTRPILEDFVVVLDARGRELRRVSVLQALDRGAYRHLLERDPEWDTGDILHTNTLHQLDGSVQSANDAFRAGRVLISSRTQGFLAVLDLDDEQVVWATRGRWSRQHDAEITPTGRLLLFDNRGLGSGRSRVLALDPTANAERILWSWSGRPGEALHSDVLGAAQELPNGNVLITESTRGRALEVDPDGRVLWRFSNPETAEERYIAAIFEMVHLEPEVVPWLKTALPR